MSGGYRPCVFEVPNCWVPSRDETWKADTATMFDWIDSTYGVRCARTVGWGVQRRADDSLVNVRARSAA